jgi:hypothetical protein
VAIPSLPWYPALQRIVAPSEGVTNAVLVLMVLVTLLILWRGDAVVKAAWAVYWVSP